MSMFENARINLKNCSIIIFWCLALSVSANAQSAEQLLRQQIGFIDTMYRTDPLVGMALCDIYANESNSPEAMILRQTHRRFVQEAWDAFAFQYVQFGVRTFDDLKKFMLDNLEAGFQRERGGDQDFDSYIEVIKSEPRLVEVFVQTCTSSLVARGFNR